MGVTLSLLDFARDAVADPETAHGFTDVAIQAGLDVVTHGGGPNKDHLLESVGTGAAFLDYDRDGWLDLYVVNAWLLEEQPSGVKIRGSNRLYRNLGDGRFADVTESAGVGDDRWGCGVSAGDYDNDGNIDLYVTNFGPNRLYRNRGDHTFEETSATAGVDDPGWGAGATFFDADADGDLDLYVANYVDCSESEVFEARRTGRWRGLAQVMIGPFGLRGGRDRFFRNQGDGTFTDATEESGMFDQAEAYGLGVLASDLDNDGDVDLYVANDSNQNYLYRNDGDGTFSEIGGWNGAGFSEGGAGQAGMGVDAGDYDGDGLQDIFVTNFSHDYSTLYRNIGDLFFVDVTAYHEIGLATFNSLSWGCSFFDYDHDADLDLILVNGHIFPQVDDYPQLGESYAQKLTLLRNDSSRFVAANAGAAGKIAISGRGLALGDYDNDGDLDLVVTVMDSRPLLLRNDVPKAGRWFALRLLNSHGSPAMNAVAIVHACGRRQFREIRSGSTYQSQSALIAHFGLGECTSVDSVEVRWPNGSRTVHRTLEVDHLHTLTAARNAR